MVAASRYADQYDGYLVGAPGYRLPLAALAQVWGSSQWKDLSPETPLSASSLTHPFAPTVKLPDILPKPSWPALEHPRQALFSAACKV